MNKYTNRPISIYSPFILSEVLLVEIEAKVNAHPTANIVAKITLDEKERILAKNSSQETVEIYTSENTETIFLGSISKQIINVSNEDFYINLICVAQSKQADTKKEKNHFSIQK